ncbi:MAG: signal peptidase I [Chlorobi bacterium CHB2]|nr:signal peptidase I [Chlorobi bacterium CHB2]
MPDQPTISPTASSATPPAAAAPPERGLLRFGARVLVGLVAAVLLLRMFVLEPYTIPTGSMNATLLEGDAILVGKLPYVIRSPQTIPFTTISIPHFQIAGLGQLERGEVVVFDSPGATPERYVKRCVAIAGDTVQFRDGRFFINGEELPPNPNDPLIPLAESPATARRAPVDSGRIHPLFRLRQPIVLPREGDEITVDSISIAQWGGVIQSEGVSVEFRNNIPFLGGLPATRYAFRHSYFLAFGDNSGNSRDSRMFGPVRYDNLVGQAWFIYWSRDAEGEVRWGRIGSCVE